MANKLMKRVEKRQRKEKIARFRESVNCFLWKWTFLCNWKATILWHRWIGKGFNPDYSQLCVASGSITCQNAGCATSYPNCDQPCNTINITCACSCPSPLPHSHYVSDNCGVTHSSCVCRVSPPSNCICRFTGSACLCNAGGPGTGNCYYNCDSGFIWNGSQCVSPSRIRRLLFGEGL
jgi:hypothetical protein